MENIKLKTVDIKGEQWVSVKGYEGYYEVSNKSRIRSLERSVLHRGHKKKVKTKIIKQVLNGGYYKVKLYKKGKYKTTLVHRIVAEAFIKNPNKKSFINHIDGNKTNNQISNLEWCTPSENVQHAYNKKLKSKNHMLGSKNPRATNSEKQIKLVKSFIEHEKSDRKISDMTGVSENTVYCVRSGRTWSHI